MMTISRVVILLLGVSSVVISKDCDKQRLSTTSKLICYYGNQGLNHIDGCYCTHVILPAKIDMKIVEKVANRLKGVKMYVTVNEFNQKLIDLLKTTKLDGLELNLKKLTMKNDISDFISTIKSKLGQNLEILLSIPSNSELVAKYFDFKTLTKRVDLFILQTNFLGASKNVTFHPSRLSGMWDMQNTDSVVDLINGLGAPLAKLAITAPVQAFEFKLQKVEMTAPGSPALEVKSLTRDELCKLMKFRNRNWTMERDEDQAGPYIFSKNQWIAFDDPKSIDIKAKYARVRGLGGFALKDLGQDGGVECGSSILEAAYNGLSKQSRAPRGAILHSLERQLLLDGTNHLSSIQLSPYRISRIIDTEGKVHVIRQDSRTEFQCSRQGYFAHPRSCNRFYRCVKFDQQSEDYNVFEFDCPAGLAFDERVEVCVWPGSLSHGTPCAGSSEIAPVPKTRFACPSEPGYYADPENCRWFFACLDHGKSPLSAYEFRCPFGLVFDGDRLVCEWSWLVPKCASSSGEAQAVAPVAHGLYNLQSYDGLGRLNPIQLGGVHGSIRPAVATVYSNSGPNVIGLGYANNGGYIEGNGLSYRARLALNQAGLLKVNVGAIEDNRFPQNHSPTYTQPALSNYYVSGGAYRQQNAHENYQIDANNGLSDYAVSTENYNNNNGIAGSINIVGGGYSAVGTASGLDLSHTQTFLPQALPVTETIPTVTAVPIPRIKTANGFHTFKGGVIANTPELQYRINSLNNRNLSTSYVNYALNAGYAYNQPSSVSYSGEGLGSYSSTARPIVHQFIQVSNPRPFVKVHPEVVISSTPASHTVKPVIETFNDVPSVSIRRPIAYKTPYSYQQVALEAIGQQQAGYSYGRPQLVDYSTPKPQLVEIPVISTPRPFSVASTENYSVQPSTPKSSIVSSYYNLHNSGNYYAPAYLPPKASVEFTPQVVYSQPAQHVSSSYYNLYGSNQLGNAGYTYQQPVQPVVYSTPKPTVEPAVVSTYHQNAQAEKNSGYYYEKPAIPYVEGHSVSTVGPVLVPKPTHSNYYNSQSNLKAGYYYQKPSVEFVEGPTVAPVVVPQQLVYSTPKPFVFQQPASYYQAEHSNGYTYEKPAVHFVETPVVSSTPAPATNIHHSTSFVVQQPAVSSYYHLQNSQAQQSGGYTYEKPSVQFVETSIASTTPAPVVVPQIQPVVYSTPKPVVSSYYHLGRSQAHQSSGYTYEKPAIQLVETPVVSSTPAPQPVIYSTPKPVVVQQPISYYSLQNSGYSTYQKPIQRFYETVSTPKSVVVQQPAAVSYYNLQNSHAQQGSGYSYEKPTIQFGETPVVSSTPASIVVPQVQQVVYSTPKPVVVHQPAVSSYYHLQNSQAQQSTGYSYEKPAIQLVETSVVSSTPAPIVVPQVQQVVYTTPKPVVVQQPAVSSYYHLQSSQAQQSTGYSYEKPALQLVETPVVTSTPAPIVVPQPVTYSPQKPAVVSSYYHLQNSQNNGYSYEKPQQVVYNTTPKPLQPAVTSYYHLNTAKSRNDYKSTLQSSYYSTPRPIQPAVITTYNGEDQGYVETPKLRPVIVTTPKPLVYSTPKPKVVYEQPEVHYEEHIELQKIQPVVYTTTTQTPAVVDTRYNLYNSKNDYGYKSVEAIRPVQQVVYSTPEPVVYTTTKPRQGYSYPKPEIVFEEPFVKKSAYVTGQKVVVENYELPDYNKVRKVVFGDVQPQINYATTQKPTYSSTIQAVIAKTTPVTFNNGGVPLTSTAIPVRSYLPVTSTTPKATSSITRVVEQYIAPEVTTSRGYLPPSREYLPVKSTTFAPEITTLSREYLPVRTRVKIAPRLRPVTVIKENDAHPLLSVKLGAQCTCVNPKLSLRHKFPKVDYDDSTTTEVEPSEKEILKAVRTGLKLVKQAAKEGAQEALTKQNLDRYGHGGVRSRTETLQGSIDCQRAGLFRHPSQCNKFYACRWDCRKNRFTLHVFDCPVHLTFDNSLGACNWPSQGPACVENTLITSD